MTLDIVTFIIFVIFRGEETVVGARRLGSETKGTLHG
jgi:hypothetical protein